MIIQCNRQQPHILSIIHFLRKTEAISPFILYKIFQCFNFHSVDSIFYQQASQNILSLPDHENPWGPGIISRDTEAWLEQFKIIQTLVKTKMSVTSIVPKLLFVFITFQTGHENYPLKSFIPMHVVKKRSCMQIIYRCISLLSYLQFYQTQLSTIAYFFNIII